MPLQDAVTRHGPLKPGAPSDGFVVVAPQLPVWGDLWQRYAEVVLEIAPKVRNTYGADDRSMCLTGFSFGGNGALDLAVLQGHFWRAVWAVDPTRVPARAPSAPVWLSLGEASRRSKAQLIKALSLTPAEQALEANRVFTDEGVDHVSTATRAYGDARIYRWLLSTQRQPSE
jgi:predicted peptidase